LVVVDNWTCDGVKRLGNGREYEWSWKYWDEGMDDDTPW
jgi:hypothetical protein